MAETALQQRPDVQWRRLNRRLWVGRRDGRHVGMIEQGRTFVVTDDEGVVRGRARDLAQAESLFDLTQQGAGVSPSSGRGPRRVRPLLMGGGLGAVSATVALVAMLLH